MEKYFLLFVQNLPSGNFSSVNLLLLEKVGHANLINFKSVVQKFTLKAKAQH